MPEGYGVEVRVRRKRRQMDGFSEPKAGDGDTDGLRSGGLWVHDSGQISSADLIDHTLDQAIAASRFPLRLPSRQTVHLLIAKQPLVAIHLHYVKRAEGGGVFIGFRGIATEHPASTARRFAGQQSPRIAHHHSKGLGRWRHHHQPVAQLLLQANCTVTICHSRTQDLAAEVARADIVVAAVGRPEMVKGDWLKPGAVVIDVGINRLDDGRLVGDVDYDSALPVASVITPVPGGVGPMTIAMLMENTLRSAANRQGVSLDF